MRVALAPDQLTRVERGDDVEEQRRAEPSTAWSMRYVTGQTFCPPARPANWPLLTRTRSAGRRLPRRGPREGWRDVRRRLSDSILREASSPRRRLGGPANAAGDQRPDARASDRPRGGARLGRALASATARRAPRPTSGTAPRSRQRQRGRPRSRAAGCRETRRASCR